MEGVQSSVNSNVVSNSSLNIGVLTPPDKISKPELFNETKASKDFNTLSKDVYDRQKKVKFEDTKKAPLPAIIILWSAGLVCAGLFIKRLFRR